MIKLGKCFLCGSLEECLEHTVLPPPKPTEEKACEIRYRVCLKHAQDKRWREKAEFKLLELIMATLISSQRISQRIDQIEMDLLTKGEDNGR